MDTHENATAVPQPIGVGPEMVALSRFYRTSPGKGPSAKAGWARARRR